MTENNEVAVSEQSTDQSTHRSTRKVREAKEELFNLRFQMATGQLDNNRRLRTVRHDIARIYTVMRERELGLSAAPDESDEGAA
jgi:large subunit ribosomal protein L29